MPGFSIREIPFSYGGSWFNLSPVTAEKTYADDVHLVSHQTGLHPVLRLVPQTGGIRADTTVTAVPSRLTWTHGEGRVEAAYESADTVRVRGRGLGLRIAAAEPALTPFSGPYFLRDPVDGAYVFTLYETGRRYRVTVLSGQSTATGTQQLGTTARAVVLDDGRPWEVAIEEYDSARPPYQATQGFDDVASAAAAEFEQYLAAIAPWRTSETPAAELAAYVLWSATVRPAGYLARPAVLMSKHWMDKVWSWDHCFNALAIAEGLPALAWGQFQLPFDHQDAAGALPDSVTHSEILYNFVKPPIHGWTLCQLRHRVPAPDLAETYERLSRWTTFWLTARRVPGHQLAHYQHGNDSGWDNATTFDPARVVESPDLAAFLVLQLRELAELAQELGHDPDPWTTAADDMCTALLDLWTGTEFAARAADTGETWTSTSLLNLMPIVLAEELPEQVRETLANRIERHLTEHGLATELPTSPHYEPDGYWRGPIWAPATVLIEDGLRRSGYPALADNISTRFRTLCEHSGFAENFDAHTGTGQRDRAYTWTASAYLLLAAAHEHRHTKAQQTPSKAPEMPPKVHDAPSKAPETPPAPHESSPNPPETPPKAPETPPKVHDSPRMAH